MTQPLFWLTLTALATTLMWVPYILNSFAVRGVLTTMGNPVPNPAPLAGWADRARKAHGNAIENLAAFAVLVVVAHLSNTSTPVVTLAAMVYFYARLVHFAVLTFGIPYVRTVSFLVGFAAQVVIALQILQHV